MQIIDDNDAKMFLSVITSMPQNMMTLFVANHVVQIGINRIFTYQSPTSIGNRLPQKTSPKRICLVLEVTKYVIFDVMVIVIYIMLQ